MKKILAVSLTALALAGCAAPKAKEAASSAPASSVAAASAVATPAPTAVPTAAPTAAGELGALQIKDVVLGTGSEAVAGHVVTVHYTGRLLTGRKFDSSVDRGTPFKFPLGAGRVIKGWDQGVAGMKVGGKRQLVIPPHLGYGDQAMGDAIPANSTLVFDVELLGVE
jgi:FKBP-type peptidyl-prolyl cis-trans isomerase